MAKITNSVEIDAPVERVFGFMMEPSNLPEVWPSLIEVSNVQRREDGRHEFDWVYKMAGVRFEGHAEATEVETNRRAVFRNESGIPSTFHYTYESMEGRTRLTLEIEYSIPNKVLSKIAEPIVRRINEHETNVLLQNVKARMELAEEAPAAEARAPAE